MQEIILNKKQDVVDYINQVQPGAIFCMRHDNGYIYDYTIEELVEELEENTLNYSSATDDAHGIFIEKLTQRRYRIMEYEI